MTNDDIAKDASFLESVDTPVLELHRNNLLKVEVDELLRETRLNVSPSDATVNWATSARDYIALVASTIRNMPSCTVKNNEKGIEVQIPENLQMEPIYGAALTNKSGNANVLPTLDCVVILPDTMWSPKDYLHQRYFEKRNLVFWHIAKYLSQKKNQATIGLVEWRFHNGDANTLALIVTPPLITTKKKKPTTTTTTKHRFKLQLLMGMESLGWIPPARLIPNRCNLKGTTVAATPFYNSRLAQDAIHWTVLRDMLQEQEDSNLAIHATLCLVKIWCLQRGFFRAHDGFGEVHLVALVIYLYRTKRATPRMAPLQVFTVVMQFLSEWNMNSVIVIPAVGTKESQTIASSAQANRYAQHVKENSQEQGQAQTLVACFQQAFIDVGPVVLDPTMMCNLFANVSKVCCHAVSRQAKRTMEALHLHPRPFASIFLISTRFWTSMDAYMQIPFKSIQHNLSKEWKITVDRGGFESVTQGLLELLGKALGDRVVEIRVLSTGNGQDGSDGGSDQIPTRAISQAISGNDLSPLGEDTIVVGFKLNPATCARIVDRGPPSDDVEGTQAFVDLWGKAAQLRRFKDGAIVHAVIWNEPTHEQDYVVFQNDDKTQGGIVERIVRHVLKTHFLGEKKKIPQFCLRGMLSVVDGVQTNEQGRTAFTNSNLAHRNALNAFDDLSKFLLQHSAQSLPVHGESEKMRSKLGIPLPIDAVEPLSPVLRYSELFPPVPHPLLGGPRSSAKTLAGVVCSHPILIQIRFGRSSKWPTDIKAMGAAKTAMLIQLADGIEEMMKRSDSEGFGGPIFAAPGYLDLGYQGYSWRIVVRADPELYLLRALHKPGAEALGLLQILTKDHVIASSHHSMIHAVHTSHPSSGTVVRMVKRWIAAHMLSGLIPVEVVDLIVAKVYCDKGVPMDAPATAVAGFMRVLHLLSSHNWSSRPLIVDPQGHISEEDYSLIFAQFEKIRGQDFLAGPPMYIISPSDRGGGIDKDVEDQLPDSEKKISLESKIWTPTFSQTQPERVVLTRVIALAKRSLDFIKNCMSGNEKDWSAIFRETTSSLLSYSALLRVDPEFVIDHETSSTGDINMKVSTKGGSSAESSYTRSVRNRNLGPKALRLKNYRNLQNDGNLSVLHDFSPIDMVVNELRKRFGSVALFFYNELTPEVVAVLWRPNRFIAQQFGAMNSEFARPVEDSNWKSGSMVIDNMNDLMREMSVYVKDTIVSVKLLDDKTLKRKVAPDNELSTNPASKRNVAVSESEQSSDDEPSVDGAQM